MAGLAGDRGIKSKRWSDSKDYLSDNMCPFAKHLKTPIFRSLESTIWLYPMENIWTKSLCWTNSSTKTLLGFVKKRPFNGMIWCFFQEFKKKMKKKSEGEKNCNTTRTFLVKKIEQRRFLIRIGIHNISFDVYISILMMHEKPFTQRVLY